MLTPVDVKDILRKSQRNIGPLRVSRTDRLIHQYLAELEHLKRVSGTHREGVVSEAFKDLRGARS